MWIVVPTYRPYVCTVSDARRYLDTTFCYGFHRWEDAITALRAIFLILFMIALVILIAVFACGIRAVFFRRAPPRKGSQSRVLACGSERLTNLLEYLSDVRTQRSLA